MATRLNFYYGLFDFNGDEITPMTNYGYWPYFPKFNDGLAIFCESTSGKYGFIDINGNFIIACKYYLAWEFKNKIARVSLPNRRIGYINTGGELIIPYRFTEAGDFIDELARVQENNKYGFINKDGKSIVDIKYSDIGLFSEGLVRAQKGGYKRRVKINGQYEIKYIWGEWGFIDRIGNETIPFKYGYVEDFIDGIAKVNNTGVWNPISDFTSPPDSYEILNIGEWGLINKYGQEIVPCSYNWIGNFKNGVAVVKKDKKYGLINMEGELLIACTYDQIEIGECIKVKEGTKWGIRDISGITITTPKYSYVSDFKFGYAVVSSEVFTKGMIDKFGNEVIPCKYDSLEIFDSKLIKISLKNNSTIWGYIDVSSKSIKLPYKISDLIYYEDANFLNCKIIRTFDKFGVINKDGNSIALPIYDEAPTFYNTYIKVCKNNLLGCIDYNGNEIASCIYNKIEYIDDFIIKVTKDNQEGYIDLNGTQYWDE